MPLIPIQELLRERALEERRAKAGQYKIFPDPQLLNDAADCIDSLEAERMATKAELEEARETKALLSLLISPPNSDHESPLPKWRTFDEVQKRYAARLALILLLNATHNGSGDNAAEAGRWLGDIFRSLDGATALIAKIGENLDDGDRVYELVKQWGKP